MNWSSPSEPTRMLPLPSLLTSTAATMSRIVRTMKTNVPIESMFHAHSGMEMMS